MTSIEWLEQLIRINCEVRETSNPLHQKWYEQAKQMHKIEIINAHLDGQSLVSCKDEYAEQYYQETFKKD